MAAAGPTMDAEQSQPNLDSAIEQSIGAQTQQAQTYSTATRQKLLAPSKEPELLPLPSRGKISGFTDLINMVGGGELAVLGIRSDASGRFTWNFENLKRQWSEEPLWSNALAVTSLAANVVAPGASLYYKEAILPARLAKLGYEVGDLAKERTFLEAQNFIKPGATDQAVKIARLHYANGMDHAQLWDKAFNYELTRARQTPGVLTKADGTVTQVEPLSRYESLRFKFYQKFGNTYMKTTQADPVGKDRYRMISSLESHANADDISWFFNNAPGPEHGVAVRRYFENQIKAEDLPETARKWAVAYKTFGEKWDAENIANGFTTAEEKAKRGEGVYWAVISPMTEAKTALGRLDETKFMTIGIPTKKGITQQLLPRLGSYRLYERSITPEGAAAAAAKGQILTDPKTLVYRSMFEGALLRENYLTMRDLATHPDYIITHENALTTPGIAKTGLWINLNQELGSIPRKILTRMIKNKDPSVLSAEDELPWLRADLFKEMVEPEFGQVAQSFRATQAVETMSTVHKIASTSLNPATHVKNWLGQEIFAFMRGHNLYRTDMAEAQEKLRTAIDSLIAMRNDALKEGGMSLSDILDGSSDVMNAMIKKYKYDFPEITLNGQTFKTTELLQSPEFHQVIEKSAFESAESLTQLRRMAARGAWGAGMLTKGIAKFPRLEKLINLASKHYLMEDAIPKGAVYLDMLSKGMTSSGALMEVGRTFPMYNTIGPMLARGRKYLIPWLSFPAETMRILKNNMMDYPLRTIPWLKAPQIMQAFLYEMGAAPGYDDQETAKLGLPFYAQTPFTAMGTSRGIGGIGGGLTGASLGAMVGARTAGAPGLLAGTAIGAVAGAVAGYTGASYGPDDGDAIRGWAMDFLPYTATQIKSNAPWARGGTVSQALQNLPADPLNIYMRIFNGMLGKDEFGNDIQATSTPDRYMKAVAGFASIFVPPLIGRYLFRIAPPDLGITELGAAGINKALGTDFAGLSQTPSIFNVSRVPIDLGLVRDPRTGEYNSPTFTAALNNLGVTRSYMATPAQLLSNFGQQAQQLNDDKRSLAKKFSADIQINPAAARDTLHTIYSRFIEQYPNNLPRAYKEATDFTNKLVAAQQKHPVARGVKKQDLKELQNALRHNRDIRDFMTSLQQSADFSGQVHSEFRENTIRYILDQWNKGIIVSYKQPRHGKEEQ